MIETTKEAIAAVNEIMALTGWSIKATSRKADLDHFILRRLISGETRTPRAINLEKIDKLYKRVSKKFKAVNETTTKGNK
jgi:hypothetical protein